MLCTSMSGFHSFMSFVSFSIIILIVIWLLNPFKKDHTIIYKNGERYIRKVDPNRHSKFYEYKDGEKDPYESYSEEELAAMPVAQRIRARRAGYPAALESYYRSGECVRCRSDKYETAGPYRYILCRSCAGEYITSEIALSVRDQEGIRGLSTLYLWISLEELADQVRRHLISEEEAKKETQELYEAAREATRRRESEESESAQRPKPKSRQEEINDIAKRLM